MIIICANLFFAYLNYHGKSFLGNNGSYFLPFLFGGFFISAYNNSAEIFADEIVMLMLIPGLDLMRLFFQRIANNKNPLKPDRNHLHHYLISSYSTTETAAVIQLLIWIPFVLSQIYGHILLFITVQVFFYFFLYFKYKD